MAKLVATLTGHADRVWNVAWSPAGNVLASCSGDKVVRIWGKEGDRWVCKSTLEDTHNRTIRSMSWSPCGKFLACASFDATTSVWEYNSEDGEFECISTLEGHENEVKSAAWDCSGTFLATCSRDKSVWIWEAMGDGEFECVAVLNGHSQDVKQVLWHPSKEMLFSASYDNTIKIWTQEDDGDWSCAETLHGHSSTVWSISFDVTGDYLASVSDDKTVIVWKCFSESNETGIPVIGRKGFSWKNVCTISGQHSRTIYSVDWSHKNGRIATACGDDCVRVFKMDPEVLDPNAPSFLLEQVIEKAHDADVNCVKWNPNDSKLLASAGDDGLVKIWCFDDIEVEQS